ncbi:uncharacterized protein EI90DRAFT_1708057 [Cantharellus anzutake]|uniref:uncharacterized protein n=1 Tax=Cantharellus anzutake TaxID=1750568 RepID=UPI00190551F2|nr:uncharacterized protein EI90DRAFT_1708057 [Cantharellus anzutake]KAF8341243.1 hypothetical protein EI90DRAFT_1708057 [Cantharellus anzutake]
MPTRTGKRPRYYSALHLSITVAQRPHRPSAFRSSPRVLSVQRSLSSIHLSTPTMSLRQTAEGLRRKIDEILAAGGDMAIPILTAVNVALPFIEESVKLWRELIAIHPGSYTPDLAQSLNNLYLALSNLGRSSEALPFIQESAKLYRELVVVNTPRIWIGRSTHYAPLFLTSDVIPRH